MVIKQVLQELREMGLTDDEIGQSVGAAQSIIFRLRTGKIKSTSFERGVAIVSLRDAKRAERGSDA